MALVIEILNDGTGTADVASYHVRVRANAVTLARGRVIDYPRANGWRQLAEQAIAAVTPVEEVFDDLALLTLLLRRTS
jgi:hypothetical protein